MISLAKKEFNAFFQSSTGVLIICAYLILNGLFLWLLEVPFNLIQSGYAQLDGLFMLSPWVFLFLIPAIGMKMLSDEKRTGTLEWLLTKPISEWQIIMGKYFAGMTLILFSLIPTFIYVITIFYFGNPKGNIDIGAIWLGCTSGQNGAPEGIRYTHQGANLNRGKREGFGSSHNGIVGFVMADGSTTFVPETIQFEGTGTNGGKMANFNVTTKLAAANNPARGLFQKLSNRNDGNPANLPE